MEYWVTRRGYYEEEIEVAKHSSLHTPADGTELIGDRRRRPGDVTHDYSTVYGWNLSEKRKGY